MGAMRQRASFPPLAATLAVLSGLVLGLGPKPLSAAAPASGTLPDSSYYTPAKTQTSRLDWAQFKGDKRLAGQVLSANKDRPGAVLHVVNKSGIPRTYVLGVFEGPKIGGSQYVVTGRMKYEKVAKQGYLEMWNVFPDGKQYFTRTLADEGPMARIMGNSSWRDLALPFDASGSSDRPARLVVQLVLTSNGAVDIGPLDLKDMPEGAK